jgi:Sortilin, neurotensin receptor 3,
VPTDPRRHAVLAALLLAAALLVPPTAGAVLPSGSAVSAAPADEDVPCAGEAGGEAEGAGVEADRAGEESAEEEALCGPQAPGEWKARQDTSGGVGLPERALIRAAADAATMPTVNGTWVKEGPDNVGGRVVGLAVDPVHVGTVYLASASGGVWKSTDSASTFQQSWPSSFPQATGAIATGRDGAVYVGTGEANPGGGSLTYEGDGVYKSTDGGQTWANVGLVHSSTIGAIAVDPLNPSRLFVAAAGSLFRTGGERGVYRSTDGGQTWQQVLAGTTATTGAVDVEIDPTNPDRIYAAMWDRFRDPNIRHYAGVGSGLYRSTDGGDTWTRLDNVTALTPGDTVGLRSDPTLGRIGIGVSSSTPGRLYVTTATSGPGDEKGFYVSDDGGDSFTTGTLSGAGGAMWWTGKVWVDPVNDRHVFVAGVSLRESTDGGQTWASTGPLHADHHAMVWDPKEFGRVYEGNDGGVYTSLANGANGSWTKATVEPWSQFYSVAVSEQDPTRIAGGLQDNGSQRTWGGTRWNAYGGGDGEQNLINPSNQDVVFNCSQFGSCRRSADGGSTFARPTGVVADRFNWFAPMEFADGNPGVVYFAGNRVNRSVDGGLTFQPVSPDLSGGPGNDEVYPFGTVTTVWSSRSDPRVVYAGTDDGRLWVARDGGKTWTMVLSNQPWITRVKVDPGSAGVAFVTLSGYRAGTQDGHVLMTSNYGKSWSDITQNLPQAPVNDIVISPDDKLVVATDVGVFVAKSPRSKWQRLGTDLPLAPVTDVQYNARTDTIYAATFGRGVYHFSVNVGGM